MTSWSKDATPNVQHGTPNAQVKATAHGNGDDKL